MMNKWPNFFIVGAPRAGTTSLYEYLKNTPDVYLSKIKEPYYFSSFKHLQKPKHPFLKKEKYLALFKKVKNEIAIGEASTGYLWDPKTPFLIHELLPKSKITSGSAKGK